MRSFAREARCMARAYGDDLRKKVLGAYAAGKGTLREIAERFDVSYGWVKKIHVAELATGSRCRVPQRRRPSAVDAELVGRLVREKPDIVLRELADQMCERGHRVSKPQLWRVLKKLGLRLKKSRSTPPSATPKRTSAAAKRSSIGSLRSRPKT
jgi:transposase